MRRFGRRLEPRGETLAEILYRIRHISNFRVRLRAIDAQRIDARGGGKRLRDGVRNLPSRMALRTIIPIFRIDEMVRICSAPIYHRVGMSCQIALRFDIR